MIGIANDAVFAVGLTTLVIVGGTFTVGVWRAVWASRAVFAGRAVLLKDLTEYRTAFVAAEEIAAVPYGLAVKDPVRTLCQFDDTDGLVAVVRRGRNLWLVLEEDHVKLDLPKWFAWSDDEPVDWPNGTL